MEAFSSNGKIPQKSLNYDGGEPRAEYEESSMFGKVSSKKISSISVSLGRRGQHYNVIVFNLSVRDLQEE